MNSQLLSDIKKVLVVVEPGDEAQPAIDRLKSLAGCFDLEAKLVACDYSQYLVEGYYFSEAELPDLRKEYLQERKELLEGLAVPLREAGLQVETEAIWSHPSYKAIVDCVDQYQPDLVIHRVRRHAALSRLLLSNDDWQLARHCTAPILMVKDKPWKANPIIVSAVDPVHARGKPSGLDHSILRMGKLMAEKFTGEHYAAHAYGQFPLSGVYPADAEAKHRAAFKELADEFDLAETHTILMEESVEYALKSLEEELDVDLVIAGSISRSILSDVVIGSTTEKVLDFLDCDALLIRPDNGPTE